jgi:hypothetical protein
MTMDTLTPSLAILGWCDRAARIEGLHPAFAHTNIQGLSQTRFSHFFPVDLRGLTLALGLYNPRPGDTYAVEFRYPDGTKSFDFVLNLSNVTEADLATAQVKQLDGKSGEELGWLFHALRFENDLLILKPGTLRAVLKVNGQEQFLGYFHLLHASVPPYSTDQIAALKTDPLARRLMRIAYSCKECGSQLRVYAGLEKNKQQEEEGWTWFADLGEDFRCNCGKLTFSVDYLRTGLHGMLSRNLTPDDQSFGSFLRLYETTKLEEDCRLFKSLMEKGGPEQEIQDFLEAHPVFFARFSAHRLIPKPRIQNKYVADFAILNQRKELLLIEIEKSHTKLLTKDRRITAELQHAITQVTDWIQEVNDHKSAVLSTLRMEIREVAVVRGIVIAGRTPSDDEDARSLRRAFSGDVEFYTYDDLLRDTTEIIRRVANA